jgi:parvulin-like peptidyl-prolyl isomerase
VRGIGRSIQMRALFWFLAGVSLVPACTSTAIPGAGTMIPGTPPPMEGGGKRIAKIGTDGFVSESEFVSAAARLQQQGESMPLGERREVLDKLVVEEILFQEAAARGLYRDPKVRKIMVNLLLREEVYSDVRATEIEQSELEAYYQAHQEEFTIPEKIQIRRIFLRYGGDSNRTKGEAQALAEELASKIKRDSTSFGGIAEQYSDDPFKRRGGDLGYVAREGKLNVPTEVIEKAFSMKVGQLSEPFDAGEGINLVLVAARRPPVERTFEQMKGSVLRRLKNERYRELTENYIKRLRSKYEVDVDENVLASVAIESRPMAPGMDPGSILPGVGPRPDRSLPLPDEPDPSELEADGPEDAGE